MPGQFHRTYLTPEARAAQAHYYGRSQEIPSEAGPDPLGAEEREFIADRDSFYIATVTRDGWPYVQHRGGPKGFLKVVDPQTLAFADFRGNHQLLSTGNLSASDRVALFLMDYPHRVRLKILGHARVLDARDHGDLAKQLTPTPELREKVERLFVVSVVSFDWNCPQYITPRYTEEEVRRAITPLKQRVAELEAKLNESRKRIEQ
jgi:predicted pyridoxine 5'-phosphate oxidase superfamily flavin-nucleotide-binding protein